MKALTHCKDDDIIIISDADEIPFKHSVDQLRKGLDGHDIINLAMDLYYYNENTKAKDTWMEAKAALYSAVKQRGPCGIRYSTQEVPCMSNAGKHLSYFGTIDQIVEKIENTAHQEYNKPEFKDKLEIARKVVNHEDIFGRQNIKFEKV